MCIFEVDVLQVLEGDNVYASLDGSYKSFFEVIAGHAGVMVERDEMTRYVQAHVTPRARPGHPGLTPHYRSPPIRSRPSSDSGTNGRIYKWGASGTDR
jgi:hypothetical protein